MPTLGSLDWPSTYDHLPLEAACRDRWEATGIHRFEPHAPPDDGDDGDGGGGGDGDGAAPGEIFAVDTPPPYVSAAHLHVGHAMSYTQAEIVVRFHRMCGRRVFYPMGFDDNGLPTERFVEQTHRIDKAKTSRAAFRALCLEETARGARAYETLWRSLGLSVDWDLRYSTIDAHCRRTAQWSFLDLYRKGRIERRNDPVLWDPAHGTALAHADLETRSRRQKLHTLRFRDRAGRELPIATTRPELLPACVALYHHPDDERWAGLTEALVPLFDRAVPVLADRDVRMDFGTGLMMVCTFGDLDDVRRWRRDQLPLRMVIGPDGRLLPEAGPYAGLTTAAARDRILADLGPAHAGFTMVEQHVPIAERSEAEVEIRIAPQWFVKLADRKDRLRQRAAELRFHPEFMRDRLEAWIDGLSWDWNISRQRFYGVPFPAWLCEACGEVVLADESALPVDPLEDPPPCESCPRCGGALRGDPDVMDTWMTSSLTPLINANVVGTPGRKAGPHPMTVRVQAHEIVRTWLFYTLAKSELHRGELPFRDVMISGWGLDEQGHKISKRNLQPDPSGFCRYDPGQLVEKYGADAVRHWAAGSTLGRDQRFSEKDVRAGRKVAVKLWNAARLVADLLVDFDPESPRPAPADRPPEDRALLHALDRALTTARAGLEAYEYAPGLDALDRLLFATFCDDWLEAAKERIRGSAPDLASTKAAPWATAWEVLRDLLGAYAPYLPFVTDAIWDRLYRRFEGGPSLHVTAYPAPRGAPDVPQMALVDEVLAAVRRARTERSLPQTSRVAELVLTASPERAAALEALVPTLRAACRAERVEVRTGPEAIRIELQVAATSGAGAPTAPE
jgi:valyl-tRNA synthetase